MLTRESALRSKTWMTNDGRCLTVAEITDDHLHNIRCMLLSDLPPAYNLAQGCAIARNWLLREELEDSAELDFEPYAAAWIKIIDEELAQRVRSPSGVNICPGSRVFKCVRLLSGWRLRWWRTRRFARQITRWWRPRMVMSKNDQEGWITTDVERWSWRRWRWEREGVLGS